MQKIPTGLAYDGFLNVHNNPIRGFRNIDEVLGVTVSLDHATIGKIQASVFENTDGAKDLSIGTVGSYSVRYSRDLAQGLNAEVTYIHLEHEGRDAEGIYFTNSKKYTESNFGVNLGAKKKNHSTLVKL